ncbi:Hypothetical_protein [Hexamita inflata]|uniref:Hypothetical_protein n=1 Tax=Hexamita inflata TaxID=28002 RepID=A0AA86N7Z3_9EUKA|nr:Hypothetical protein HINF_LOCUS2227 [Hexamita inflata]
MNVNVLTQTLLVLTIQRRKQTNDDVEIFIKSWYRAVLLIYPSKIEWPFKRVKQVNIQPLFVIDDGFIRLRFSFLAVSNFLRCCSAKSVAEGKIPRFKVLSYRQGSVWLRACHQ